MILVYDGSFEGFLSLVYEVYYKKIEVSKILKSMPQSLFIDDVKVIETNIDNGTKVLDAIKNKFTPNNFENILTIFMCDTKDFEFDLLGYIILGFKEQKQLANINQPCVFYVQNLLKEYFRHHHKMTGFTRFVELDDGTLYAKIDTKFNVVYHLGKHFLKRFNNQKYIIHDIKRKIAFIHNEHMIGVQEISSFEEPNVSENEEKFSRLWCKFFDAVSIESRTNEKLQKQWVPLLYREFMTEFI